MKRLIALMIAAACCSCPAVSLAGDAQAADTTQGTTVKGSKSNSSERAGGSGGTAVEGTTVKSSKSNSQDRLGAGGGTEGERSTVKSSKSNSSERTTVKGSKSNSDN